MESEEPDLEFLDELELSGCDNGHSSQDVLGWGLVDETSANLAGAGSSENTPISTTINTPPETPDSPYNDSITLEDLQDPERCLDDPEKYSQCLTLERLECATRAVELTRDRAIDFVQKQLNFVKELKGKRQDFMKSNAELEIQMRLMEKHLRTYFNRRASLLPIEGLPLNASQLLKRKTRHNKLTSAIRALLVRFVRQAALDLARMEIAEQFDKHLKRKGLNDKEIETMEEILGRPGVEQLYSNMTKRGMFKPEDSLARLHELGQTVDVDQLLALLEADDSIPLMNILEWKHVTLLDLRKVHIAPEDIDPCPIDWARIAEKMQPSGYKFSSMEWYSVWCNHIQARKLKASRLAKKSIMELVKVFGRDWKGISNYFGSEYSEEECKKMYYDQLCALSTAKPSWHKNPPRLTKRQLVLRSCWLAPKVDKLLRLQIFKGSFSLIAATLNYAKPRLRITSKELQRQHSEYWHWKRQTCLKYSMIEDALLLVTISQVKSILQVDRNLSCLRTFLPWRPPDEWRLRLRSLAGQWFDARFTMQENMKLIYLANVMPSKWVEISKYFNGFDRKACRGHYIVLRSHLSRGETLLQYQAKHGPKRVSTHYIRVKRMINFLISFITNDGKFIYEDATGLVLKSPTEFRGFKNPGLPTQEELRSLLGSKDQTWVMQACKNLVSLIQNIGGPPRLPEVSLKSRRKLRKATPIPARRTPEARAKRSQGPVRSSLMNANLNLEDFTCCDSAVATNEESSGSSSSGRNSPRPIDNFDLAPVMENEQRTICVQLRAPKRRRKDKNIIPALDTLILPKGKRKPGRKSGRLSQIRREVALSRWRKKQETRNDTDATAEPKPEQELHQEQEQ